jgi:hypothetical protein
VKTNRRSHSENEAGENEASENEASENEASENEAGLLSAHWNAVEKMDHGCPSHSFQCIDKPNL